MHKITNVDFDTELGDCSVCGTGVKLKRRYGKQKGTYNCYLKYREKKYGGNRFADGTQFTAQEHTAMFMKQDGRCAICREKTILQVDHCHENKMVRGMLCRRCNIGLGNFRDNPQLLASAINYLS